MQDFDSMLSKASVRLSQSSANELLVETPEGIPLSLAREMAVFIERNFSADKPEKFPEDWLPPLCRAYFGQLAEAMFGEMASSQWLQTKLFFRYGESEDDYDAEQGKSNIAKPIQKISDKDKDNPIVASFVNGNPLFIKNAMRRITSTYRIIDEQMAGQIVVDSIYYALGNPVSGRMDQRLNFFIRNPRYLNARAIDALEKANISFDDNKSTPRHIAAWLNTDGKSGRLCIVDVQEKNNLKIKRLVIEVLKGSALGPGGLYETLLEISATNEEVKKHVEFVMISKSYNHMSRIAQEQRKIYAGSKTGTLEYDHVSPVSGNEIAAVMVGYTQEPGVSGETLVTEGGVHNCHAGMRPDSYEEKYQKAIYGHDLIREHLLNIKRVSEVLVSSMRDAVNDGYEKLMLEPPSKMTESARLEYIIPDLLSLYVDASLLQVENMITPDMEVDTSELRRRGLVISWKQGRGEVSVNKKGVIKCKISKVTLEEQMQAFGKIMIDIKSMFPRLGYEEIANQTGHPIELVRTMVSGINAWNRSVPRTSSRDGRAFTDFVEFFTESKEMRAKCIKTDFAHRWTKMQPHLFKLENPDEPWDAVDNPRVFQAFPSAAIRNFMDLITIHQYIPEGTIPITVLNEYVTKENIRDDEEERRTGWTIWRLKTYAVDGVKKNGKPNRMLRPLDRPDPGKAWGWNTNRESGMTNTETYWALMGQPIDESQSPPVVELPPKIAEIRDRIRLIRSQMHTVIK